MTQMRNQQRQRYRSERYEIQVSLLREDISDQSIAWRMGLYMCSNVLHREFTRQPHRTVIDSRNPNIYVVHLHVYITRLQFDVSVGVSTRRTVYVARGSHGADDR